MLSSHVSGEMHQVTSAPYDIWAPHMCNLLGSPVCKWAARTSILISAVSYTYRQNTHNGFERLYERQNAFTHQFVAVDSQNADPILDI